MPHFTASLSCSMVNLKKAIRPSRMLAVVGKLHSCPRRFAVLQLSIRSEAAILLTQSHFP
jgi:hypothetical protein